MVLCNKKPTLFECGPSRTACLCMAFIHRIATISSAHDKNWIAENAREKKANSMRCIPLVLPNCLIYFRICIIWMTTQPRIERYADSCTSSDLSNWNKPAMNHFIPAVCGCNAGVASVRLKMPPRNSQSPPPSPLRFPSPLLTLVGQAGVRPSTMQTHTPSDWQKHRDVCKWVQAGRPCAGE